MNICSINMDHEPSVCIMQNNKIVWYNEERKLNKLKKTKGIPFACLEKYFVKENPNKIFLDRLIMDKFIVTGYNFNELSIVHIEAYLKHINVMTQGEECFSFHTPHHLSHAYKGFIDSGFEEARVFVVDGRGSDWYLTDNTQGYEVCSVYDFNKTDTKCIYKNVYVKDKKDNTCKINPYYNPDKNKGFTPEKFNPIGIGEHTKFEISHNLHLGNFYNSISELFGYVDEEGKFMGYQSKGKFNQETYDKFLKGITRLEINKLTKNIDVARTAQIYFEDKYEELVKKFKTKNMVFTGGTALNVINNYKLTKKFKDCNLWFDPLCTDVGNSIGNAYIYLKQLNQNIEPLKNIYLGGQAEEFLASPPVIYLKSGEKFIDTTIENIIDILEQGNVVGLFQGKSEAGPRALGNRSLLLDPTIKEAKDIMNEIKNRESFRPFACSVLEEKAGEYFEMENIKNTPFMMHAPTVKEKAKKEIPALVHDDDTCRIQTVNQNDNKVLHEILTKFKKPIIMNTSFNLAGRPIVETIRDALYTARQSKLKYVYFADVNKLFIKCH